MKSSRKTTAEKYSRRAFVKRLGVGAALLPMLEADFVRGAPVYPKRVIIAVWTNGVLAGEFFPAPGAIETLPRCTSPLLEFKSDLLMLSGIDMKNFTAYGDHGAGHEAFASTFTGTRGKVVNDGGPRFLGGSASVDQYIARELAKTTKLPFASLDQATFLEHYWHQSRCFFRGSDDPVTPEQSPARAFDALFAGKPLTDPTAPTPPVTGPSEERLAAIRAERRSILDFLGGELQAFGTKLGKEDRQRIEGHLQSVRDLERQIGATTPGGTSPPTGTTPSVPLTCDAPRLTRIDNPKANDNYPKVLDQQIDIIVHALKCDLTRVATLMTMNGNATVTALNWLDVPANVEFGNKNYHGVAHRGGDGKAKVDTWYMERFAALLRKLKSVREGDGTMLDNTVVLWANHMGNGGAHNVNDLPWILAGSCGGYFKTGRYVRKPGTPTNAVMKGLCSAMGVNPDGFGDPRWGGEMPELRG